MRLGPGAGSRCSRRRRGVRGSHPQFPGAPRGVEITGVVARGASPAIILATARSKGPRMDFMVEKAAELGATEFGRSNAPAGWCAIPAPNDSRDGAGSRSPRPSRASRRADGDTAAADGCRRAREVPKGTLARFCTEGARPWCDRSRDAAARDCSMRARGRLHGRVRRNASGRIRRRRDSDRAGCAARPRRSPRSALRPERWTKSKPEESDRWLTNSHS